MFRLVQISDTHFLADERDKDGWSNLASAIRQVKPDLVVHTGDILDRLPESISDHAFARHRFTELGGEWLALPGNHDVGDGPPAAESITGNLVALFEEAHGGCHWLRDIEDWRFIGVNAMVLGSSLTQEETAEWDFLQTALGGAAGRELALFVHKPVFVLDPGEAQPGTDTMPLAASSRLWRLMLDYNVRLVASGHRHEYRALQRDGISLVWAPAASTTAPSETTVPFFPAGVTHAGFVEYVFSGKTVAHRPVVVAGTERQSRANGAIDLRSDVLGLPSPAVLQAIADAGSASPGFSRHEDRHQQKLTAMLCEWFGFADGLFLPTGYLANQIALRVWCNPGEAILAEGESHIVVNEAASVAGLNGVTVRTVSGKRGHLSPDLVENSLRLPPSSWPERRLRLVWLENTHNRAGGTVMPEGWLASIAAICSRAGIPIHVDGARIFDAVHASGVPTREIVAGAASLMICLNKGPGAPHGAMLLGSRDFIEEAERVQKMFGALWRPAGMLAAAAVAALQAWPARIAAAHGRAQELASALAARLPEGVSVAPPETNIVMLSLGSDEAVARVLIEMAKRGVRGSNYRRGRIRLSMHGSISKADVAAATEAIAAAVG